MTPLILASLLAVAPGADAPPTGPIPVIRLAKMNDKGELFVRTLQDVPKTRLVERVVEEVVDGKKVQRKVTEAVTTFEVEVRERRIDTKGLRAEEVGKGKVDVKSLPKRLARWRAVVVAPKPLGAAYKGLFVKGTLVLVLPAARAPGPAPRAPVPKDKAK
jgi:hypothetical protein